MTKQPLIEKLFLAKKLVAPEVVKALEKQEFVEIEDNGGVVSLKNLQKEVTIQKRTSINTVEKTPSSLLLSQQQGKTLVQPTPVILPVVPKDDEIRSSASAITEQTPPDATTTKTQENNQQTSTSSNESTSQVQILQSFDKKLKKWEVKDFVDHYTRRYELLSNILKRRATIDNLMSINSVRSLSSEQTVSIIGLIQDKFISRNGHLMLEVEDTTHSIRVVVSKNNAEVFKQAQDIVVDEVVAIKGSARKDVIFANELFFPDIPFNLKIKKAPTPGSAVFLSDIHVGSKQFLEKEFNFFLSWIQGKRGTDEEKALAKNVKYILVSGDVVDGVGIYPQQNKELAILDIYQQYEELARLLSEIPQHIEIILAPGNHDAMRLSEPQPPLSSCPYAGALQHLPNVTFVSNPGMVTIHASEEFEGFKILLYHGYSFDYYVAKVPSLKEAGGYDNPCAIMQFLLSKRHLAPSHSSSLYLPEPDDDFLTIKEIPDIFLAGHVHRTGSAYYRGVLLLNSSCWQGMTSFQEKTGHNPSPAKVQIVDLQTRKISLIDFSFSQSTDEVTQ